MGKFKLIELAKPYVGRLAVILVISLLGNGLSLVIPKITATIIDSFRKDGFNMTYYLGIFLTITLLIFLLSAGQTLLQTYLSEKLARDLRTKLITRISKQSFSFINDIGADKLLTNLTTDIDNVKQVVAMGFVQIFSSIMMLIGATVLLLTINWRLALIVLTIIPLIAGVFVFLFGRIRNFFTKAQKIIDKLNKTINESIVAAALIRIVNSQQTELQKFNQVSLEAKGVGLEILKLFASLIPLIGVIANASLVAILVFGGQSIIEGTFTLGGLTAFMSYVSMLIFPIIVLGFISNLIARAAVSYERIVSVLDAPIQKIEGKISKKINGDITFDQVSLVIQDKQILKDVSFKIKANSRTAIIGPTAAGKTQLFYLLAGLLPPTSGKILIDGIPINKYESQSLADQIGLVFQDSSIFNTTIRENINFKNIKNETNIQKAINTAELNDFIKTLSKGLETILAERGSSLSGGQKQRLTLARALTIEPQVLLLDDFTARVDKETEKKIFVNLKKYYKNLTQILISQQIASVVDYDQIILLMEGELLTTGTHSELLKNSIEYKQIFNSQKQVA